MGRQNKGIVMVDFRPILRGSFSAILLATATLLVGCGNTDSTSAASAEDSTTAAKSSQSTFSYDPYNALLKTYVSDEGFVNYKELQANHAFLDDFIASMGALDPAVYESWSKAEKLAFWINAYNAITLKYIIDNYPIKKGSLISGFRFPINSIRQIPGVWDKLTTEVVGEERTLDAIEHEILRAQFHEPRIHVAIVCASISCPPLRNEAFIPERLEEQLDDQARKFLANDGNFHLDHGKSKIHLSSILNWFSEDFIVAYGIEEKFLGHNKPERSVLNFISQYLSEDDARYLAEENYSIAYQDYNWSLNER